MRREWKPNGPKHLSNSQNFITDTRLHHRIVNISSITREDTFWEIGTGKGLLTQVLCQKCRFLYSAEIDRKLFEKAKERLISQTNLKLIYGDLWKSYTTLTNAIFIPCHR